MVWGALIGAAGTIGAGLLSRSSSSTPDNSTFYQNWRNDDMAWAREQFDRNEALQREFAQNGIRWRADDARAAGLHPLAALGASGASAAPISVGGGGNYSVDMGRSSTTGPDFRGIGQDLSRAYMATRTKEERVASQFELARQAQQLQYGDLQNQEMALRIARLSKDQVGPGMPSSAGVGVVNSPASGQHELKPYEVDTRNPGAAYSAPGPAQPSVEYRMNPNGSVTSYPAKGMNLDELSSPGYFTWMLNNRLAAYWDGKTGRPPDSMLPKGAIGWKHQMGTWYPKYWSDLPARPADYPAPNRSPFSRR